jgi:hypothetical protein
MRYMISRNTRVLVLVGVASKKESICLLITFR